MKIIRPARELLGMSSTVKVLVLEEKKTIVMPRLRDRDPRWVLLFIYLRYVGILSFRSGALEAVIVIH